MFRTLGALIFVLTSSTHSAQVATPTGVTATAIGQDQSAILSWNNDSTVKQYQIALNGNIFYQPVISSTTLNGQIRSYNMVGLPNTDPPPSVTLRALNPPNIASNFSAPVQLIQTQQVANVSVTASVLPPNAATDLSLQEILGGLSGVTISAMPPINFPTSFLGVSIGASIPLSVTCISGCSGSGGTGYQGVSLQASSIALAVSIVAGLTPQFTQLPYPTPLAVQTVWVMGPTATPVPTATPLVFPTVQSVLTVAVINLTPQFTQIPLATALPTNTPVPTATPPPTPLSPFPTIQYVQIIQTTTPTITNTVVGTNTFTPTPTATFTAANVNCLNCTPPPTPYSYPTPLATWTPYPTPVNTPTAQPTIANVAIVAAATELVNQPVAVTTFSAPWPTPMPTYTTVPTATPVSTQIFPYPTIQNVAVTTFSAPWPTALPTNTPGYNGVSVTSWSASQFVGITIEAQAATTPTYLSTSGTTVVWTSSTIGKIYQMTVFPCSIPGAVIDVLDGAVTRTTLSGTYAETYLYPRGIPISNGLEISIFGLGYDGGVELETGP